MGFQTMPIVNWILRWTSFALAVLSLAASVGLLIADYAIDPPLGFTAAAISAAPLFLAGASFLIAQTLIRPRSADLLKNVLLAGTFLLWGAVQLMPQNTLSRRLGNVVIALYVLDIAWVTIGAVISREKS
jgi:hypothetical protein